MSSSCFTCTNCSPGDCHIQRTGMPVDSFEKNRKRYQDPVLWAGLEIS